MNRITRMFLHSNEQIKFENSTHFLMWQSQNPFPRTLVIQLLSNNISNNLFTTISMFQHNKITSKKSSTAATLSKQLKQDNDLSYACRWTIPWVEPECWRVSQGFPAGWFSSLLSGNIRAQRLSRWTLAVLTSTLTILGTHLQLCHQLVEVPTATYDFPPLVDGVDLKEGG